jgi:hypothetical protein
VTNRKASERKLNYVCVCFVVGDVEIGGILPGRAGIFVQPVLGRAALLCDVGARRGSTFSLAATEQRPNRMAHADFR